ncbi:GNAT family N-acetyltransferase [Endozoicomonas montiporae]|uniref:GNAT family N-acetyltransferase n=1 Tax=Endozoicomonas montiporae TaxID=1027273 RepID=UPI0009E5C152
MANGIYYKISYSGNIIGGIYLIRHNKCEMEIDTLFISQEYQDKKIGSKALSFLENKHTEVKKWTLFTPYKDFRNHHFYEKHNYKKLAEIEPFENDDFKLFKYEKLNNFSLA